VRHVARIGRSIPGGRISAVFALALLVRLLPLPLVLRVASRSAAQGFGTDSALVYLPLGRALAERGEFGLRPGEPTASFVPLYPLFLAGLDRLGLSGHTGRLVVQASLGAALLALVYAWVRRVAGERTAVLAALLAAIVPDFAVFSYLDLSENLSLLFVLGALLLFERATREPDARWWAWTGALLGLAALTREFCLTLLVPLAVVGVGGERTRGAWARVGVMAAACLVVILPWTARNYATFGELIPLTDKAALNFYIGTLKGRYHPSDPRRNWGLDGEGQTAVDARLKENLRAARSGHERDSLYLEASWRNLVDDPRGQAAYLVSKAGFFWQANVGLRHRERIGMAPLLAVSEALYWGSLAGAAVAVWGSPAPRAPYRIAWALIGWTFLFHLFMGEAEPRYHFTLLPAIFALASTGWWSLARRAGGGRLESSRCARPSEMGSP